MNKRHSLLSFALFALAFTTCATTAFAAAVPAPDQPVLIDTSSSAGSVVASSSSSATYSAANAFDGNWSDNAGSISIRLIETKPHTPRSCRTA